MRKVCFFFRISNNREHFSNKAAEPRFRFFSPTKKFQFFLDQSTPATSERILLISFITHREKKKPNIYKCMQQEKESRTIEKKKKTNRHTGSEELKEKPKMYNHTDKFLFFFICSGLSTDRDVSENVDILF